MTYHKKSIHGRVLVHMHPEDAAQCFNTGLSADDVVFTPLGSPALANTLYLRLPGGDRKSAIYYYFETAGGHKKHYSTHAKQEEPERAVAWVLSHLLAREDRAMSRTAPETIPVQKVIDAYAAHVAAQIRRGDIAACTGTTYLAALKRAGAALRGKSLADLQSDGPHRIDAWHEANGFSHNTSKATKNVVKRATNWTMTTWGSAWRVDYRIGMITTKDKQPFEPTEVARILDHITNGTVYNEDGTMKRVWSWKERDMVPARVTLRDRRANVPFSTAVPLMLDTATRHQATCQITFTDPRGPWIDLDLGVLHRRGEMTKDNKHKRRGSCVLSSTLLAHLRPIAEARIASGITHLVVNWQGTPLKALSRKVWRRILQRAAVQYRRIHCLKDTAIQIARREGVGLYQAAERFATTPGTLIANYGADWDMANQIDAAEAMGTREKWTASYAAAETRRAEAAAAKAARAAEGSALASPQAAPVGERRHGHGGRARPGRPEAGRKPAAPGTRRVKPVRAPRRAIKTMR